MRPTAVEFLVHLSLSAAVASVNSLAEEGLVDRDSSRLSAGDNTADGSRGATISRSEHVPAARNANAVITHQRVERYSVTGAQLDLVWRQLHNVEYLTDGGNSWIHTSVFNGKPVVVKTLKPECQDVALAINEIEGELGTSKQIQYKWRQCPRRKRTFRPRKSHSNSLHIACVSLLFAAIHSRLNHPNIVDLIGAGSTSKGVRFVVLERLDGGTLTQMLGYDTRIRDRRRRFWRKKQVAYLDVLKCARSIASAMQYCHEEAIPGSCVLHRDLKPDNIGKCIAMKCKLALYFTINVISWVLTNNRILFLYFCRFHAEWHGEASRLWSG
jgi:serine/threonine protein kinase